MSTLKLFYVKAEADDGFNLDLIVSASTKKSALAIWLQHFDRDDVNPQWVKPIPAPITSGAVCWEEFALTMKGR